MFFIDHLNAKETPYVVITNSTKNPRRVLGLFEFDRFEHPKGSSCL
ncbi:MAG: hypothetical protein PHO27_00850 [Sulfuricurvum sp.]|nr:hypothetical protein [Sulfuricurvum sp.]